MVRRCRVSLAFRLSCNEKPWFNLSPLVVESWVEVEQREGGIGSLTHTSSKEELKQLLASAASEEELSDTDVV